jgi:FAD/FMN-containing dehydrogenase
VAAGRSDIAHVRDARCGGAGALARVLAATLVAALMLAVPAAAHAKSFSMPSARIDAQVAADGSLAVKETRSFEFIGGEYTRVYWELEPPAAGTVVDVAVTDASGKPVPPAPAGPVDARPAGFSRIVAEGGLTRVDVYERRGALGRHVRAVLVRGREELGCVHRKR